jgi:hypothetical protein
LNNGNINSGNGTDSVLATFTSIGIGKISVVEIQNNCVSDTSSKTIEVKGDNGFNNFKVSPNPTTGLLNIEFETAENTIDIELFDMLGKSLMKTTVKHPGGFFK